LLVQYFNALRRPEKVLDVPNPDPLPDFPITELHEVFITKCYLERVVFHYSLELWTLGEE
jgi:hypothetical protein